MERLEASSETSLGKTSKQTSFHFILLTLSHNQLTWSNSSTVSNFDKFPTKDLHKTYDKKWQTGVDLCAMALINKDLVIVPILP